MKDEATKSTDVLDPRGTLALAIEKGMDPATIGKMMDLQERWEANQARKAYVEAMAGFKRECPAVIGKDKKADFGTGKAKYSYATTGAIVTAITPILSKFGLSLSWENQQHERQVTVTCHVTHAGGHRESATLTGPHDESGGKNPIQMLGSSVHYLQRYTMVSVLGLATADMDDPDAGNTRPPIAMPQERQGAAPATPPPAGNADAGQGTQEPHAETLEVSGMVEKINPKNGKKPAQVFVGGKPYASYHDGAITIAAKAFNDKSEVVIQYHVGPYGNDIESITGK